MFLGAPLATGILRGAAIEGAIGAGVEIPIQAAVQLGRRQFGEDPSLTEAVANVAAAGAGGFMFSALLRTAGRMARPVARSTRALLEKARSPKVRAAREYLQRKAELEEASPLGDYPRAKEEHVVRLSEATRAVMEGRAPDIPRRPRNPVRETPDVDIPNHGDYDPAVELGLMARKAAELDETDRLAAEVAGDVLAKGPEAVSALYKSLKAKPKPVESLLTFLRRTGGIQDDGQRRQGF
jgi:hypothetical protein